MEIKLGFSHGKLSALPANTVAVYLIPQDQASFSRGIALVEQRTAVPNHIRNRVDFSGTAGETLILYGSLDTEKSSRSKTSKAEKILLIGTGTLPEEKTQHTNSNLLELIRRAAGNAVKAVISGNKGPVNLLFDPTILFDRFPDQMRADAAIALFEGAVLGAYSTDSRKTKRSTTTTLRSIEIVTAQFPEERTAIQRAHSYIEGTIWARELGNAPGNELYPATFADKAKRLGRQHGFGVTVFDEKKIRDLKMGGLLAVSSGSQPYRPPRFLVLKYSHARPVNNKPIVLIGKGITFDSGGISIKPSSGMAEMKMDMSGAAAVLGTFISTSMLKLPVQLIGLIPLTENMPGGNAQRPGDVITIFGGKSVEVDNTDAEGRLVLADALEFAKRFYQPETVIDLATLTGAVVVALGTVATGMMGTDEETMNKLRVSGEQTFERVWQLPLYDEYLELIKSDVADVKNVGGRWAGAITAGCFLKTFAEGLPWVHLDIAGTAMIESGTPYISKGASGVGVRLLTRFLESRLNSKKM